MYFPWFLLSPGAKHRCLLALEATNVKEQLSSSDPGDVTFCDCYICATLNTIEFMQEQRLALTGLLTVSIHWELRIHPAMSKGYLKLFSRG